MDNSDLWVGGYDATCALLDQYPDTDGIIYTTDLIAAGGLRALFDRGIKVPDDVAIIGINNSVYAEICNPRLTSLDNKVLDMSTTGASVLVNVLEHKRVAKKMMIFSEIVERETT